MKDTLSRLSFLRVESRAELFRHPKRAALNVTVLGFNCASGVVYDELHVLAQLLVLLLPGAVRAAASALPARLPVEPCNLSVCVRKITLHFVGVKTQVLQKHFCRIFSIFDDCPQLTERKSPGDAFIFRKHDDHSAHVFFALTIWKDPVIEMQRTKAQGLLYKQLRQNSKYTRTGMAEYLMIFRKWS